MESPLSLEEAEDLFLKRIGRGNRRAGMHQLEVCLNRVSVASGREVSDLRSVLISPEGLSVYLQAKVTDDVVYEGVRIPRRLADVDLINEDPEKYVESMHAVTLGEFMKKASYLYYNYGGGGLLDTSFDALEYVYRKKTGGALKTLEKMGAPPVERIRARLPHPMGSLAKVKLSDTTLYAYLMEPLTVSSKLDGVTCLLVYEAGKVAKVYTGGDGEVGADVTYLRDYINLPSPEGLTGFVRGELVISKANFRTYAGMYANPRSFVASRVNSGYVTPGVADLEFLAYEWVGSTGGSVSEELEYIESRGFSTPTHTLLRDATVYSLVETYRTYRRESAYAIDGLVISTPTKPRIAFKMLLEEQVRKTVLLNVEWNVSRYGRLIPKAIYRPVYIDGTRQTKASLSNYRKVTSHHLTKGHPIEVVRSGDVIPMVRLPDPGEVHLPDPGEVHLEATFSPPLTPGWHVEGSDAVLDDIEGSYEVAVQRVIHFVEILGVRKFGEESVKKVLGSMRNSPSFVPSRALVQLFSLPARAFQTIMAGASGLAARTNLHAALETARLDRLVAATSIIRQVGRATIKTVLPYLPGIFNLSSEQISRSLKTLKIPGIGPAKTDALASGIPALRAFLESLDAEAANKAIAYNDELGKRIAANSKDPKAPFRGVEVVFTKFLGNPDLALEDLITDQGGSIGSKVSMRTTAVITNNPLASSSKMISASQLGIPVLTIKEFRTRYHLEGEEKN